MARLTGPSPSQHATAAKLKQRLFQLVVSFRLFVDLGTLRHEDEDTTTCREGGMFVCPRLSASAFSDSCPFFLVCGLFRNFLFARRRDMIGPRGVVRATEIAIFEWSLLP